MTIQWIVSIYGFHSMEARLKTWFDVVVIENSEFYQTLRIEIILKCRQQASQEEKRVPLDIVFF